MTDALTNIREEAYIATKKFLEEAKLEEGALFVVGCSTSEVNGATIGTHSSIDLAELIFSGVYKATQEARVYLVAQ